MHARFDLYALVHKGQRLELFDLSARAGRLGARDAAAREALHADVRTFLDMLASHAESEDEHVGPLLAACAPEVEAELRAQHGELDRLSAEVRDATDDRLYPALCRLTAFYLRHVDLEEHVAQPALWAAFDDARLAAVHGAILAAQDARTIAYNLRSMVSAASSEERVGLLSGFRRRLPPPAFAGIRAGVEHLVRADEWRAIEAAAS